MQNIKTVNIHVHARCEFIEAALLNKKLDPKRGNYSDFVYIFFLLTGTGHLSTANQDLGLVVGSVLYIPVSENFSVSIHAGSSGYLLGVSQDLLIESLGFSAESVLLREFSERNTVIHKTEMNYLEELYRLSHGFMIEMNDPKRGSRLAVAAYFRLVIMSIWRLSGNQGAKDLGYGEVTTILQRFRHLVEKHYRERWTVKRYADELLISHDRLHAMCTRTLLKKPRELIQERVIFEAKLRLERSGSSIQQLSNDLGFSDSTTFSHYFKRYAGTTPAGFRRMSKRPKAAQQQDLSFGYANWP